MAADVGTKSNCIFCKIASKTEGTALRSDVQRFVPGPLFKLLFSQRIALRRRRLCLLRRPSAGLRISRPRHSQVALWLDQQAEPVTQAYDLQDGSHRQGTFGNQDGVFPVGCFAGIPLADRHAVPLAFARDCPQAKHALSEEARISSLVFWHG